MAYGVFKLVDRRHPHALARVGPKSLNPWSFLNATAHGAGLMLLPLALGLCAGDSQGSAPIGKGREAMSDLMRSGLATSLAVAAVHTITMVLAAGFIAWIVYRWVELKLISSAWLNLDGVWAASLVLTGAVSGSPEWLTDLTTRFRAAQARPPAHPQRCPAEARHKIAAL